MYVRGEALIIKGGQKWPPFILERFKMPPAKKATSLASLLGDNKDNTPEEKPEETPAPDRNEDTNNLGTNAEDNSGEILDQPGSEVVESEKPVEQNPDGVTFSGRENPINKTPAELSAESPEETKQRFGINDEIPDTVANNPNIQWSGDENNYQVPGGTHLHPDVAKDNYNRNLAGAGNGSGTTRTVNENVYATEAEVDDKGRKDVFDRDEDYTDDEEDRF